jgi:hypothetical protein
MLFANKFFAMRGVEFESVFSEKIIAFVAHKRALGYRYDEEKAYLQHFDKLCVEVGVKTPALTKELAERFVERRANESIKTRYNKVCIFRQFARYLNKSGDSMAWILRHGWRPVEFPTMGMNRKAINSTQAIFSRLGLGVIKATTQKEHGLI